MVGTIGGGGSEGLEIGDGDGDGDDGALGNSSLWECEGIGDPELGGFEGAGLNPYSSTSSSEISVITTFLTSLSC